MRSLTNNHDGGEHTIRMIINSEMILYKEAQCSLH
jgi:hypothetical protein